MKKKHFIVFIFSLFFCIQNLLAQSTLKTMSDVNNVFEEVEFKVMLQTDMQKAESLDLPSKKYFISMSNYIDLNVIGKGKSLVLSSDKITTFILSQ